jgi:hypothetical protein
MLVMITGVSPKFFSFASCPSVHSQPRSGLNSELNRSECGSRLTSGVLGPTTNATADCEGRVELRVRQNRIERNRPTRVLVACRPPMRTDSRRNPVESGLHCGMVALTCQRYRPHFGAGKRSRRFATPAARQHRPDLTRLQRRAGQPVGDGESPHESDRLAIISSLGWQFCQSPASCQPSINVTSKEDVRAVV